MTKAVFLYLCVLLAPFSFAMRTHKDYKHFYKLEEMNLSYNTKIKTYEILLQAQELLPPAIKEAILANNEDGVIVEFRDQKDFKGKTKEKILGWIPQNSVFESNRSRNIIALNSELIKEADEKILRTIIHETIHIFDYQDTLLGDEKKYNDYCNSLPKVQLKTGPSKRRKLVPNDKACVKFQKSKRSLSKSPMFLTLAGWNRQGLFFKTRRQLNDNFTRSPDHYEFTNPSEFLAVNMEYFLLDDTYQCRRPTLYKYFKRVFNYTPFKESNCESYKKVIFSSGVNEDGSPRTAELDSSRLYQIHYLFASKGESIMSKWGHAMFRLVMCKPGRKVGPDCLNDRAHHIVLTFRADVEEQAINYISGIKGDYASKLFILSLQEVIDSYGKGEFRDLESIPLYLTKEEMGAFVDSALEQYWAYRGAYYFFTNNCASEVLRLLKIANYKNYSFQAVDILTPLGVIDLINKYKLGNTKVLEDRKKAVVDGHLFLGESQRLIKNYNDLSKLLGLSYKTPKEFLNQTSAVERRSLITDIQARLSKDELRTHLAKFLQLESYAIEVHKVKFSKKYSNFLLKLESDNQLSNITDQIIKEFESLMGDNNIQSGYGIPLISEVNPPESYNYDTKLHNLQELNEERNDLMQEVFPESFKEGEEIIRNKSIIKKAIIESFSSSST